MSLAKDFGRRWFIIIVTVLFLISGCAQEEKPGKVILRFSHWLTPEATKSIQRVLKEDCPEVEVKIERTPWGSYRSKILTEIAGGYVPDIMITSLGGYAKDFIDKDVFLDLTPFIEKDRGFDLDEYFSEAIDSYRYKGKLFCIPYCLLPDVIFYNKDLFQNAGLSSPASDWDWNDFLEKAQKLTLRDEKEKVKQYGFAATVWRNFLYSNGGNYVDNPKEPRRCTLDEEVAKEALQFYVDLIHKYKVAPVYYEQYQGSIPPSQMFMAGKVAMYNSSILEIRRFQHIKNFQWDMVRFPKSPRHKTHPGVFCGGGAYAISRTTKHPEKAWKVLKCLVGPRVQWAWSEKETGVPTLKKIAEKWLSSSQKLVNKEWVIYDAAYGNIPPSSSKWEEVRLKIIIPALYFVICKNEKSVDETIEEITSKVNQALQGS